MYLNLEIFDDIFHDLYLINFLKRGNATFGSCIYKWPGNLEAICNKVGGADTIKYKNIKVPSLYSIQKQTFSELETAGIWP